MVDININTRQLQSFLGEVSEGKLPTAVKAENLNIRNLYIGRDNRAHVSNSGFMRWIASKTGRATGREAFRQAMGAQIRPLLEKSNMGHAGDRIVDNLLTRIDNHREKHFRWSTLAQASLLVGMREAEPEPSTALGKLYSDVLKEEIPKQQHEDAANAGKQEAENFVKNCTGGPYSLDTLKAQLDRYESQRENAKRAAGNPNYEPSQNEYQKNPMRALDPKLEMIRLDASIAIVEKEIQQLEPIKAKIDQSAAKHGLSADQAKSLYGEILEHQKQVAELRKTDPAGTAWLDKTPRQCAKELLDSLRGSRVDTGDVMIKLADLTKRTEVFCGANTIGGGGLKADAFVSLFDELNTLSPKDKQALLDNIQSNYELCALFYLKGATQSLDRDIKSFLEDNYDPFGNDGINSNLMILGGFWSHMGDMMLQINHHLCDSLGVDNPAPLPELGVADGHGNDFNSVAREISDGHFELDSTNDKAKKLYTIMNLAAMNGGDVRKAVDTYNNGITTPEDIKGMYDHAKNYDRSEQFKNFGYVLENQANEDGNPLDRFKFDVRVFAPSVDV